MKLMVHIGRGKTGSTAIQAFMNANRGNLIRKEGILYPNTDGTAYDQGDCHNHSRLIEHHPVEHSVAVLSACLDFARKRHLRMVVISSETPHPRYRDIIRNLLSLHRDIDPRILAYLRRQDHLIEASWKEWGMKHGHSTFDRFLDFECPPGPDGTRQARPAGRLNHAYTLSEWEKIVPRSTICVRPYEAGQLRDGDGISDFLDQLGRVDRTGLVTPPDNRKTRNSGLQKPVIELMRLTYGLSDTPADHAAKDLLYEALPDLRHTKPFQGYGLLDPVTRLQLLEMFEPMNREIAHRYLGREDQSLFLDPWPTGHEAWQPTSVEPETFMGMLFHVMAHLVAKRRQLAAELVSAQREIKRQTEDAGR